MKVFSLSLALLLLLSPLVAASSESGSLRGTVSDRTTHRPVPGASVVVIGSTLGAEADSVGRFLIPEIPPGTISVRVSSIGYAPESAAEVSISPGRTAFLDFALDSASISGKEVRKALIEGRPVDPRIMRETTAAILTAAMAQA